MNEIIQDVCIIISLKCADISTRMIIKPNGKRGVTSELKFSSALHIVAYAHVCVISGRMLVKMVVDDATLFI